MSETETGTGTETETETGTGKTLSPTADTVELPGPCEVAGPSLDMENEKENEDENEDEDQDQDYYKLVVVEDGKWFATVGEPGKPRQQYRLGETYHVSGKPRLCQVGFHACKTLVDCFMHSPYTSPQQQVLLLKVTLLGSIKHGARKSCASVIRIEEVVNLRVSDTFSITEGYPQGCLHLNMNPDTSVSKCTWWVNGRLTRGDDLPAEVHTQAGVEKMLVWRREGDIHRDADQPAVIELRPDGSILTQKWYTGGNLHRDADRPACIILYPDGSVDTQKWYRDGKQHRDADLPAVLTFFSNGTISVQEWYRNGKLHRDAGQPARVLYRKCGAERTSEWWVDGQRHRGDGKPAVVLHANPTVGEGQGVGEVWYRRGVLHREDNKPAIVLANGSFWFYCHGRRHREGDEPAARIVTGNQILLLWFTHGRLVKKQVVVQDGA